MRAVKSCRVLGSGFCVVEIGGRRLLQSVPRELNTDESTVLALMKSVGGCDVCESHGVSA